MNTQTRTAVQRLEAQELPIADVWRSAAALLDSDNLIADITSDTAYGLNDIASALLPEGAPVRPRLQSRGIRVAGGAAVVVAVIALAIVVLPGLLTGGTANAVTPPPLAYTAPAAASSSTTVLRELAAAAGRQPAEPGSGSYTYTKIQSWDVATTQDISGNVISSAVVPTVRETWAAPDGSGRESRFNPDRAGSISEDLPPGSPTLYQDLPADPEALKELLGQTHPDRDTSEWFVAVTDVWGVGRPVPPATQEALLILLAGEPDITVLGTTVDRAGRPGIAISTDTTTVGFSMRSVLIFDDSTGRLLSSEQVALTDSSTFPVEAPATIGYTMWLTAAKVATSGTRP